MPLGARICFKRTETWKEKDPGEMPLRSLGLGYHV